MRRKYMLKKKVALITGSTSGIGLGIAQALANKGCNIIINGLCSKDEAEEIVKDLKSKYSVDVIFAPTNLADRQQIDNLVTIIDKKFSQLDILVNNAGIQHVSSLEEFSDDNWDKIIEINLNSAFRLIKRFLPYMKKNKWGRIINIASAHGLVASPYKSAYVAAKHGIVGLTKVVALETAQIDITCNAICPGWVKTPLVIKQIEAIAREKNVDMNEAEKILLSEKQPSLKFIMPSDVGELVVFLCNKAAAQITGSSYSIDGGWVAR